MMVPRTFLLTSAPSHKAMQPSLSGQAPGSSGIHLPSPGNTSPVVIPPRRSSCTTTVHRSSRSRTPSKTSDSSTRSPSTSSNGHPIPTSFTSMLDATSIPVPRKTWTARRSRKLPRGNHVKNFSRMLQEGVQSKEDHLMEGSGSTALDILLSPPDEEDENLSTENDSEMETPFSLRSVSSDSTPSLEHDDQESPYSLSLPLTPASPRSPSERRQLRCSQPEDCAFDHPLLHTDVDEPELADIVSHDEPTTPHLTVPAKRSAASFRSLRLASTFKSNLTASLRAIKSAAQSVSTFATPSVQPDDFLTRSLFTITPELTDDRRPPPMQDPPSPALRRYLNPTPTSPAEMYVYRDHRHEPLESSRACAVSIQMQTYRRNSGRGHRRNNFHVAAAQGHDCAFDPEIPPMPRQREPRENSHFLRMVVLEMNMRRSGKLREDIPTRARIWLPPRKTNPHRLSADYDDGANNDSTVPSRWVGVSV
ncbi:hypothetical protein N7474_000526 [Penicillium riverlandense]|uniref:uncharacterized protein n=1 Tax=Penicillium riverlandense TaxID=1903569 RepID=UPI0025481D7B|nr:uncharacterized protein N7474_000526 [Penicillium riverlandense]KAJ5832215.1 hypothetical protein N7474_000526 [Penicillium riverlandense]